ncbi:sigma-70 family RNA polymerase sigma factor [Acetobacter ascendens]|uniref:DNA-directed RNA polymerase sigma-70 factor n=1 Tax=Acetobacter ascendens TaxID=481146 RepID=A0A1D8QUU5_9PROT|nr:sigma-70 family RNA polymerase sigma factor [Acetobacter ascendens]RCL08551.1 XRE family transcriptional regulator [Acetobacter pasteurianus]GCD74913.1 RNA polymerase sigma-E factor (sigma-24) protein 2 [Acetobacter pasteurianus NBRC 3299]AOW46130.1 DNA-directed RNA polymerase sigma-70 factor [Acetobacter ascendens]AOW49842.1 DNA-directed RNA polymerase sigma-70 factor [Acetobacter ascendens]ARW11695.1 ECF RNA polymerase sigma factor EcfG [Acetobacter ascendens]
MTASFHDQVIAILPKLRVQALALTRNRSVAEDLVQDTVCNALAAQDSFVMGTNFAAWMHRILRNRFISDLRKKREVGNIDDTPQSLLSVSGRHEDRLALKELDAALARLPDDQREALVLGVLEGMSYQELADVAGCAVGTAKSRVFRARRQLEVWLMGEEDGGISGKTGTESTTRISSTRRKTRAARNTTRNAQQTA